MIKKKYKRKYNILSFFLLAAAAGTLLLLSSCTRTAGSEIIQASADENKKEQAAPPAADTTAPASGGISGDSRTGGGSVTAGTAAGGTAHRSGEAGASAAAEKAPGQFAIAARDPLAAQTALQVLESGGTAADAAFAAGAAISVSEPHFSHALGGGTWALYYNASRDEVRALDGVGITGSLVELSFFQNPEKNTPFGPHRVIVPGAWDAWMIMLRDEGTMHMDELLKPAIKMAEEGVPASRSMVGFILQEDKNIRPYRETADIFLPGGTPPRIGDIILQADLAETFKNLSKAYRSIHDSHTGSAEEKRKAGIQAARDYYYRGPIAAELSRFLLENGGFVTKEDFSSFEAEWRDPIYTWYKDTLVYGCPPNSQGVSMLLALNILENMDLTAGPDDPLTIHRIIEATKLAKIDTWHYVAEPGSMPVHVDILLSKEYAARQVKRISDNSVITWPAEGGLDLPEENNTTMFAVADAYGNTAAVTTSTGAQFLVGGKTGILLNQRMAIMEIAEGNPNIIGPNKKVRHTVNPYMAFRSTRFLAAGGNTGFDTQPQGQIQQFINMFEFGMSPMEAVGRKRFITHAFPASHHPHRAENDLFPEPGTPVHIIEGLKKIGHRIGRGGIIGNANVIVLNHLTGNLEYGADPRGENKGAAGTLSSVR